METVTTKSGLRAVWIDPRENRWVRANMEALDYVQGTRELAACSGDALGLLEELYVDTIRELFPARHADPLNRVMIQKTILRIRGVRYLQKGTSDAGTHNA